MCLLKRHSGSSGLHSCPRRHARRTSAWQPPPPCPMLGSPRQRPQAGGDHSAATCPTLRYCLFIRSASIHTCCVLLVMILLPFIHYHTCHNMLLKPQHMLSKTTQAHHKHSAPLHKFLLEKSCLMKREKRMTREDCKGYFFFFFFYWLGDFIYSYLKFWLPVSTHDRLDSSFSLILL